jgi:Methyltransferase domain
MTQASDLPLPPTRCAPPLVCSLCGNLKLLSMGAKDFGHSGNDHFVGRRQFADYDVQIEYFRCQGCGLMFTPAFDAWSPQHFAQHIYNADYVLADPPFSGERSARNAAMVAGFWHRQKDGLRLLDYSGGAGGMVAALAQLGIACESCDPYYGAPAPAQTYPVVTCFEVLEHVPHKDQLPWFKDLAQHIEPGGTLLLSTEVFGSDISAAHWYLCPRNGHISVHSTHSLHLLAASAGLKVFSINSEMHLMRRPG